MAYSKKSNRQYLRIDNEHRAKKKKTGNSVVFNFSIKINLRTRPCIKVYNLECAKRIYLFLKVLELCWAMMSEKIQWEWKEREFCSAWKYQNNVTIAYVLLRSSIVWNRDVHYNSIIQTSQSQIQSNEDGEKSTLQFLMSSLPSFRGWNPIFFEAMHLHIQLPVVIV